MDERCETCRFWRMFKNTIAGLEQGQCRRFPPLLAPSVAVERSMDYDTQAVKDVAMYATCPSTPIRWWCGEYQPAQTKGATE